MATSRPPIKRADSWKHAAIAICDGVAGIASVLALISGYFLWNESKPKRSQPRNTTAIIAKYHDISINDKDNHSASSTSSRTTLNKITSWKGRPESVWQSNLVGRRALARAWTTYRKIYIFLLSFRRGKGSCSLFRRRKYVRSHLNRPIHQRSKRNKVRNWKIASGTKCQM